MMQKYPSIFSWGDAAFVAILLFAKTSSKSSYDFFGPCGKEHFQVAGTFSTCLAVGHCTSSPVSQWGNGTSVPQAESLQVVGERVIAKASKVPRSPENLEHFFLDVFESSGTIESALGLYMIAS